MQERNSKGTVNMSKIPRFCLVLLAIFYCHRGVIVNGEESTLLPPDQDDAVCRVCEETLYQDVCKATLHSDPWSKGADNHSLAKIALQIAANNATAIYDYISDLAHSTTDEFPQQCLIDCSEGFQDAIKQLQDSITALETKSYKDATTWITAAMTDAQSCEEGFMEEPGHESPITEMNQLFSQICSIALTITNKILATFVSA